MIFFKAFAFTKLDSLEGIGNPAHVVIFDELEEMDKKLMSYISLVRFGKFLITVFLKKNGDNNFDLRYYTQYGEEWTSLCGHATICAAGVLRRFYDSKISEFIFHLGNGGVIRTKVDDDSATISLPTSQVVLIANDLLKKKICEILSISNSAIDVLYKSKMNDYVLCLNNEVMIRKIAPNLSLLEKYANDLDYRAMIVMQKSVLKNIDFEVRVFSHLALNKEEDNGEDVACGSANCSIASVVRLNSYKVLFPYQYNVTGKFGGLQFISHNQIAKSISLSGGYTVVHLAE